MSTRHQSDRVGQEEGAGGGASTPHDGVQHIGRERGRSVRQRGLHHLAPVPHCFVHLTRSSGVKSPALIDGSALAPAEG